eukprot:g7924.t1
MNKRVRIVGKVLSVKTGEVTIIASDGGQVVIRTKPSSMQYSDIMEFTGVWNINGFIQEHDHTNYSDNFDLSAHNRLLILMHGPYKKLFYEENFQQM